jgi:hypothetical protein
VQGTEVQLVVLLLVRGSKRKRRRVRGKRKRTGREQRGRRMRRRGMEVRSSQRKRRPLSSHAWQLCSYQENVPWML